MLAAVERRVDRRAHVQRDEVVGKLGPVAQLRNVLREIQRHHRALHELHVDAGGEAGDVDADVVEPVVAGDQAGQHARIDLLLLRRDERYARAVQRLFCEVPKDGEVRVAGSDKQDSLHACLSFAASRLRSSFLCTLPVVVIGSASRNSISRGYS